ncbi:MAG: hypothetical protein HKN45_02960 [Flavobacteriales bacterium]|nr:hypothetical protein [Flavobacteriales bacterium]
MSPIHSLQDLTIDFSQLGAVELQGEPMKTRSCAVKLSFQGRKDEGFHKIRFKKYSEARKLYEDLIDRWMRYEEEKQRTKLIRAAEKELYF